MKVLFRVFSLTIFLMLGQNASAVLEIEITQGAVSYTHLTLPTTPYV